MVPAKISTRFLLNLLNISLTWNINALGEIDISSRREWSKKHALSLSEGSVRQGRSQFDARSVLPVRERERREERRVCEPEGGNMARTPLAAFFNIPILVTLLTIVGCTNTPTSGAQTTLNPVEITEWPVPWEHTRPRDPFVDQHNRVWFVGQRGDYIGVLDPNTGQFKQYPLEPGTGPHNLIVDDQDQVWYAGNRAAHIGKLDSATGHITKHAMPDPAADDPHTLVFGKLHEIWFTVQGGNFIGNLIMDTGRIHLIPLPTLHARPYGIVVDSAQTPWFTEFGANKLGTIDRGTNSVREIELPRKNARPRRLAITPDGAVWYVDYAEGYVGQFTPSTGKIEEWQTPGGDNARPYGMAVDDHERVWFVETGSFPNRLVGFDTRGKNVISITTIKSGGGTVRHMVYHKPTQTLWFGTDANTIARATLP